MCLPNNVIFTGTTTLFDETLFPKCPDRKQRTFTRIGENPNDIPLEVMDDDDDVYHPNPPKIPQRDLDHCHDDDRERADPPAPVPPLQAISTEHEPVPGPSSDQPTPSANEALMASLCREGGVELMNFLISKAVPDNSELLPQKSNVREWTYRNIIQHPLVEK
ncbi:hypothetical protein FIBSPDRAFT_744467, partial [Athelia psychrophila]